MGRTSLGYFVALTLIASGCASLRPYDPGPGRRAAASVLREKYVPGEPINVTVANLSEVMLFYPDRFCKTQLQKKEQGGWLTVADPSKGCPAELGFLDPGQVTVYQYHLPSGVAGGVYRLAMPMPLPDDATQPEGSLVTPTFTVDGAVSAATASAATAGSPSAGSPPKDR
jgi:hypothetical protein